MRYKIELYGKVVKVVDSLDAAMRIVSRMINNDHTIQGNDIVISCVK